jgi:hypothetical protein
MAMVADGPVHMGTDSLAFIKKGEKIIEHLRDQEEVKTKTEDGTMLLGGKTSRLHREMPWKGKWTSIKDGDLWKSFADIVRAKGATYVKLLKVKAHSSKEDVEEGRTT